MTFLSSEAAQASQIKLAGQAAINPLPRSSNKKPPDAIQG
jgi:hypothetical protein